MPAPVEFTVRVAALTPGFDGDAQALATEISERLMITPSEPWSSFINGGAQPSSNVGPYLRNGNEWLVWSDSLGTYTYHVQNGAGLVDATVTLAAHHHRLVPQRGVPVALDRHEERVHVDVQDRAVGLPRHHQTRLTVRPAGSSPSTR